MPLSLRGNDRLSGDIVDVKLCGAGVRSVVRFVGIELLSLRDGAK